MEELSVGYSVYFVGLSKEEAEPDIMTRRRHYFHAVVAATTNPKQNKNCN
jgi:hypothetical protein